MELPSIPYQITFCRNSSSRSVKKSIIHMNVVFRVNSNETENEKYILIKREKEIIFAKFFFFVDLD